MATWQTLRDFARGIVRIGSMEPEDIKRGELWFDESDPRYAAKDPHSYDAHEYGKHPDYHDLSIDGMKIGPWMSKIGSFGRGDVLDGDPQTIRLRSDRGEPLGLWIRFSEVRVTGGDTSLYMRLNNEDGDDYDYSMVNREAEFSYTDSDDKIVLVENGEDSFSGHLFSAHNRASRRDFHLVGGARESSVDTLWKGYYDQASASVESIQFFTDGDEVEIDEAIEVYQSVTSRGDV